MSHGIRSPNLFNHKKHMWEEECDLTHGTVEIFFFKLSIRCCFYFPRGRYNFVEGGISTITTAWGEGVNHL